MFKEFHTTVSTASCIEDIIVKAKERIVLVSPYLKHWPMLMERLVEADHRGVRIVIVYGKTELDAKQSRRLHELKNLSLYYYQDLHAKCYFNENTLVISSMNLHEYSQRTNREMSISVRYPDMVYKDAAAEVDSIVLAARLDHGHDLRRSTDQHGESVLVATPVGGKEGHCIRCGCAISRDKHKPFCGKCFWAWGQNEDVDCVEKYCHLCGARTPSKRYHPFCPKCMAKK